MTINIEEIVAKQLSEHLDNLDVTTKLQEAVDAKVANIEVPTRQIEVITPSGTTTTVPTPHHTFEKLLIATQANVPILLTGEAGTGKSESVVQVATALGYTMHSLSVGEQTTKTDLLGFIDANGVYRSTGFRQAFEHGGIFLLDEVDAGNPNVLLAINSGLSNGFIEFPDTTIHKHETFRLIATANTYGTGADMQYVGRNKLDMATLNRFAVMHWTIDLELESLLTSDKLWLKVVRTARTIATDVADDILIGMRNSLQGDKLLQAGLSVEDVFSMVITKGLDRDTTQQLNKAIKEYTKAATITAGTQVIVTDRSSDVIGKLGYVDSINSEENTYYVKIENTIHEVSTVEPIDGTTEPEPTEEGIVAGDIVRIDDTFGLVSNTTTNNKIKVEVHDRYLYKKADELEVLSHTYDHYRIMYNSSNIEVTVTGEFTYDSIDYYIAEGATIYMQTELSKDRVEI
jgi:hypothetical protein